jgi:DNA-binding NtrC family response regulator
METDNWRGQLPNNRVPSYKNQSVLILNQNSFPCPADKCDALLGLLQTSLTVRCTQEECDNRLPDRPSSVPDLILLRPSIGEAAQELIESCKEKWNRVAMLALLCTGWEDPARDFSPILSCVDDFLSCPFNETELLLRIKRLLQSKRKAGVSAGAREMKTTPHLVPIVAESPCFLRVIEKLPLLADCDTTVLISGETGSGKEVMARAIHYQGTRRGKPFIPVNCGALPDHLFENELFGHAKGAFTDASSAEKGLIVEAESGTLFLDEIDALSQSGQVKLLRFLQNGEYRPVGSSRSAIANVRVIAATNVDLSQRVKSQLFREDLYYRLNSLSLPIPPLRERIEDIVLLVTYFLDRYAIEHSQKVREISQAALRKLMAYSWPGNVRELESVITKALVFTTAEILQVDDIELPSSDRDETFRTQSLREAKISTIRAFERGYLAKILATHQGNITHAAKAAGKERRTFQRLLRKHNLDRQSFRF